MTSGLFAIIAEIAAREAMARGMRMWVRLYAPEDGEGYTDVRVGFGKVPATRTVEVAFSGSFRGVALADVAMRDWVDREIAYALEHAEWS